MAKTKLNQEQQETLAKLSVIAGTYAGLKAGYESARLDTRTSKAKYDRLSGEVEDLIAEIEEEVDDANRQALRVELSKKKKELEELETETAVKQASKSQFKTSIDQSIEEMKELPGVRQAIQELVAKKYDKEIKRLGKEKENEVKDKENLEKITELTDEDKTENAQEISDNFKDMLDARNEMKKAKAKVEEIDRKLPTETDPAEIARLNQQKIDLNTSYSNAQAKYQTARTQFIALSKGADVDFEEADVDHIVAVINDNMKRRASRPNDYNLEKVLQKQLAKTSKNIESLDGQKAEYEQGKSNLELQQEFEKGQSGEGVPSSGEQQEKLHFWNPLHWKKMWARHKQRIFALAEGYEQGQEQQEQQQEQQQPDNDKAHKAFVRELQRNATIENIVNREMRETRDRAADVQRSFEDRDDK